VVAISLSALETQASFTPEGERLRRQASAVPVSLICGASPVLVPA
jgi:hypothetical protein